jgi:hypothetical protein
MQSGSYDEATKVLAKFPSVGTPREATYPFGSFDQKDQNTSHTMGPPRIGLHAPSYSRRAAK